MKINDINNYINARNALINLVNSIDENAKKIFARYGECALVKKCFIARQSAMKQIQYIENVLDAVYPQWRGVGQVGNHDVAEAHRRFNEECHQRLVDNFNEQMTRDAMNATRIAEEHANFAMQQTQMQAMNAMQQAQMQMNAFPPAANTNPFGF